jgi:hypothetical protein
VSQNYKTIVQIKIQEHSMDYNTVATIVREQSSQVINEMNLTNIVQDNVRNHVTEIIEQQIQEQFKEIRENLKILNQQIVLLKDAIQTIHAKNSK